MIERDNIHYDLRAVQGYAKPFNLIISPREDGKSTTTSNDIIWHYFDKYKATTICIVRNVNEISDGTISKRVFEMNKFRNDKIEVEFKVSDLDKGIVPVYLKGTNQEIMRFVSLNIKLKRLKDMIVPNPSAMIFDEYIIDTITTKEKYLTNEFFRFKELFNTIRRENPKMRAYFLGNPYTLFCPFVIESGIDFNQIKKNKITTNGEFLIDYHELNPKLKEKILAENPLYQFDEDYIQYALEGNPTFDKEIRLCNQPNNFRLWNVISLGKKTIGIFKNTDYLDDDKLFFCAEIKTFSKDRSVYVFDIADLISDRILFSSEEKFRFSRFSQAFRNRQVLFESINLYYLIQGIYKLL